MTRRTKRKLIDMVVNTSLVFAVYVVSPWWTVFPLMVLIGWNYYDGLTRGDL